MADLSWENFIKEVFLDSETSVGLISTPPGPYPQEAVVPPKEMAHIRDEINRHPYLGGTLGMALSGPDTGGSQWFVTHSPQPHLDGTYTVFGRVVRGMEAAGRVLPGDRIIRVEEVR